MIDISTLIRTQLDHHLQAPPGKFDHFFPESALFTLIKYANTILFIINLKRVPAPPWKKKKKIYITTPGQSRKHCCGNIVSCQYFAMFPKVGKQWATMFPQQKPHLGNMKCFWIWLETFLLPGKQILFPQQCFHGWANRETFEETSRVTNICLPRALAFQFNLLIFHWFSLT